MIQISDKYFSTTEAAQVAGISAKHVVRLIVRGIIEGEKVGRNWLVLQSSAQAFRRHPTMGRPKAL